MAKNGIFHTITFPTSFHHLVYWESRMSSSQMDQLSVDMHSTLECTLQINEPQLQRSKHQCATHQRLSTSTVIG